MVERNVIVCDFEGDARTGDRLLNILRENPSPPLEVCRTTFVPGSDDARQRQLSTLLPEFNPKVALIVPGSHALEVSSRIFDEFARIAPATAIIAVVDPSEPLQIAELLRRRADDFLIAPFACPANVVPR